MTLTELRYIVAVAREKHFGHAAESCFVSQPTLSVAIKKLEEELDVKLFERGANEVSVTHLGEAIVRQAQTVIEQAAAIMMESHWRSVVHVDRGEGILAFTEGREPTFQDPDF